MVRFPKYLLFFLSLSLNLISQKETYNWYFGQFAGLNFSTNPPTAIFNSSMVASAGCSSVSDSLGNLLFYTNGQTVWNKHHLVMANGTGLFGALNASQSGLVVKKPGSLSEYYIFTASYYSFGYSIVDVGLASGNGSVTVKNKQVFTNWGLGQKYGAAMHCNGKDIWLVTGSSPFYAFLISNAGIDTNAVLSYASQLTWLDKGTLKISPNGKKVAFANYIVTGGIGYPGSGGVELFDFDNSTGILSNSKILLYDTAVLRVYGCEFSPDGTKLYAASYQPNTIYQWDLCAGSASAMIASQYTAASTPTNVQLMSMQLASDGKIYICKSFKKYLAAIKNPNALGSSCNYVDSVVSIAPKTNNINLPSFLSSHFEQKPSSIEFNYNISQSCLTASFNVPQALTCPATGYSLSSLSWHFGDVLSGSSNTSSLIAPTHNFSQAGTYTVTLIVNYNCNSDTTRKVITVGPQFELTANQKPIVCAGGSIALSVAGGDSYLWQDGSNGNSTSITPLVSAYYSVVGTNSVLGCSRRDSIFVSVLDCTGLSEYSNQEYSLNVFPNPSRGEFEISCGKTGELLLFNEMGQEIARFYPCAVNKNHIKVNDLAKGIYFIKMDHLVRKIVVN